MGEDTFNQEYDDAYGFRPSGTFGIKQSRRPHLVIKFFISINFFVSIIIGGALKMILTDFTVTRGNLFEQVEMVFDDLVSIILRIYKGKFLVLCSYKYNNVNES